MPAGEGRHEKIISITARSAEKNLVERAADVAGTSVNKWGRAVLLDAARDQLRSYLQAVSKEPTGQRQQDTERAVLRE